jgi:hypothetical protein
MKSCTIPTPGCDRLPITENERIPKDPSPAAISLALSTAARRTAVLIVTGSRAYPGTFVGVNAMVRAELERFRAEHPGKRLVLIHGGCPHPNTDSPAWSIDRIAHCIGRSMGMDVLPRPANWSHGRKAGPIRNGEMAREGASWLAHGAAVEVTAFPYGEAKGTRNMIKQSRAAGLEVKVIPGIWDWRGRP